MDQDLPKEPPILLHFRIMFYPEDVECELVQEVTRHVFFLEVKEKILSQDLYCPPETAMMMAAYAVQAQKGDYDNAVHKQGCIDIESFLPQRVSYNWRAAATGAGVASKAYCTQCTHDTFKL